MFRQSIAKFSILSLLATSVLTGACQTGSPQEGDQTAQTETADTGERQFASEPLVTEIFTADPSAHVFEGKIYIYPSHDVDAGIPEADDGSHFDMRDYHVYSMEDIDGEVTDHGIALAIDDIPWAGRQLWAPDAAYKDGTYYLYFPVKDKNDVFRIGVATSNRPEGPFSPQPEPIAGSYSIDPTVFTDDDGSSYMYFGGIWGGQLQRWQTGEYDPEGEEPADDEPAISPKVARMSDNMMEYAETPRDIQILDEKGDPILAGDHDRRFFEAAWLHKYNDRYYFSYSTGDTHNIVYATGDNPYGPFTYEGILLYPVMGWTNHHSIVEYEGKWYLFYHDVQLSGKTHLRNIKVAELNYRPDGSIEPVSAFVE